MIIEHCEQGGDDWQRMRLGVVTASNFGKVMAGGRGKTRKTYMRRLAEEITSGRKAEHYASAAMARGTALEPRARAAYIQKTKNMVTQVGFVFLCEARRVGGSPDGLVGFDGGLEIKCPMPNTYEKYQRTGRISSAYMAQIQGNLWLTKRNWWDFVSFSSDHGVIIRRILRDEPYIARLSASVESFVAELDTLVTQG